MKTLNPLDLNHTGRPIFGPWLFTFSPSEVPDAGYLRPPRHIEWLKGF